MLKGPKVAPLLSSWRAHVSQPGELVSGADWCRLASISCKSSGDACLEPLELWNLTCMLTRSPSTLMSEIHSVNPCTSTHGPGEQFSGVRSLLLAAGSV